MLDAKRISSVAFFGVPPPTPLILMSISSALFRQAPDAGDSTVKMEVSLLVTNSLALLAIFSRIKRTVTVSPWQMPKIGPCSGAR